MNISLSKSSEIPLRVQIVEQIVFLITTGQLCAGQQLPSVRALARKLKVHHNTVSEAYQELVRRDWLSRKPGSRLFVGMNAKSDRNLPSSLDELINESINCAREMGYSLQTLTDRVRQRLLAAPPDRILVVEEEALLRGVIQCEIEVALRWRVSSCSPRELLEKPHLAADAQVFAPAHIINQLKPIVPASRPPIPIIYSSADECVRLIQTLKKPSIVAAVSVSESILKIARGLFASVIGRRHSFQEIRISGTEPVELEAVDVAFCDSLAIKLTRCRRRIRYQLVAASSLEHLAPTLKPPAAI